MNLQELPTHARIVIIGGGVIGIELGQVYLRLGAQVSVVEYLDRIIPGMDGSLSKELQRVLKKNLGFEFLLKHKVIGVKNEGKGVTISVQNNKEETLEIKGDYCLVSVGRKPYTDGLNLDSLGINTNQKGQIEVSPLAFIRGRTFNNTYLIVDEAQNSTIHELKTIITRIGEGSKIVLLGDTDQIDTPYLDSLSNGLTVIVEKFKQHDIAAHITLMKGERSELATLASQVL